MNPGEVPEPALGLADRLDELLLRLEVWRERPAVASLLIGLSALVAAAGWWLAQPSDGVALEHVIPMASADEPGRAPAEAPLDDPAGVGQGGDQVGGEANGEEPSGSPASDAGAQIGEVEAGEAEAGDAEVLVVHVVGAVENPGLVRLLPGSRIDDALRAAGGPTEDADVERLNLAAPISDGMQVRLPRHDEEAGEPLIITPAPGAATAPSGAANDAPAGPMNLNTASETELQDLPGVGPATAAAIVGWRDDNGGFITVDDLTQVPGVGPVKLAALRDLVAV